MRIPLDYYRILGLPIQATAEQLEQAYRDRTLQLPRREYSEYAIQTRKQLIDEAFNLLSDPIKRKTYDDQFLAGSYASSADAPTRGDSYGPTIEIEPELLAGALLILLELGEYELVIKIGRPYLSSGQASLNSGQFGDPTVVLPDVVLTLAMACLELGREQWQQHHYENAAESLETGRELLTGEDLFPSLRTEVQSDLYKLRPYRILELVARPLENKAEREKGILLLKAMLEDRGGIDGAKDDLSGLSVEDFLRFIQQLRSYLTAAEQQDIFETEAQRPSAVGTYLAVYALLGRGFAQHQPVLVRRAKQLLMRLSSRQDIHLEQSVCAVLLGQTEEASRALELSREQAPLDFIRGHSQGSPDLLPGLCLYSERWLQQEVFPLFRDLGNHKGTLKDYFANEQVQSYLENLPLTDEGSDSWQSNTPWDTTPPSTYRPNDAYVEASRLDPATPSPFSPAAATRSSAEDELAWLAGSAGVAGQVSQLSPPGKLGGRPDTPDANGLGSTVPPSEFTVADDDGVSQRQRRNRRMPKWGRLSLVLLLGLLCLGAVGFVAMRLFGWLGGLFSGPRLQGDPLSIELIEPAIELPSPGAASPVGINAIAQSTLETWFEAKATALGEDHDAEALDNILVGPLLAKWQKQTQDAEDEGWHAEYVHSFEILEIDPEEPDAPEIKVQARVNEKADFYLFGTPNGDASYDEVLGMEYTLIREGDSWLIKGFRQID
ncbi:MAG: IMS domain-containing protein [Cyanobacteria bacterium P01_F01_bin.4]